MLLRPSSVAAGQPWGFTKRLPSTVCIGLSYGTRLGALYAQLHSRVSSTHVWAGLPRVIDFAQNLEVSVTRRIGCFFKQPRQIAVRLDLNSRFPLQGVTKPFAWAVSVRFSPFASPLAAHAGPGSPPPSPACAAKDSAPTDGAPHACGKC